MALESRLEMFIFGFWPKSSIILTVALLISLLPLTKDRSSRFASSQLNHQSVITECRLNYAWVWIFPPNVDFGNWIAIINYTHLPATERLDNQADSSHVSQSVPLSSTLLATWLDLNDRGTVLISGRSPYYRRSLGLLILFRVYSGHHHLLWPYWSPISSSQLNLQRLGLLGWAEGTNLSLQCSRLVILNTRVVQEVWH